MKLLSSLLRRLSQAFKTNPVSAVLVGLSVIILVILLSAFVSVMFCETCKGWVGERLGLYTKNPILKFLGIGMGGVLLALQALMSYRRAKALEDTASAQAEAAKAQARATKEQAKANQTIEQGQRQERLKNAIEHLGHVSDSVRLGGAYELFHLAEDTKELRQTVLDILCAHIRRTTGEDEYQEKHKSKPSEEVQSLLTLLFVQEHEVFKGLRINLQGSWLNGANLNGARLEGSDLSGAYLRKAYLDEAQLRGAWLVSAYLQGATLREAQLQRAHIEMAELQGANLGQAQLQGATLADAHLRGAALADAHLQGAALVGAHLQGAALTGAHLQGAALADAHLQGATLVGAHLQGAWLMGAYLQGAALPWAELQGVTSQQWSSSLAGLSVEFLEDRIRAQSNSPSDLLGVIFAGGLSQEDLDSCIKGLPAEKAKELQDKLTPHVGKPESRELPQGSRAITRAYTAEEAEQWITEYEKAMSEVPETGDN